MNNFCYVLNIVKFNFIVIYILFVFLEKLIYINIMELGFGFR